MTNTLEQIIKERFRQDEKWGVQTHAPEWWLTILVEEVGEVARAIQVGDVKNYREELVQCAAVCVAALENLDRNEAFFDEK